ncbi:MAG: acyl carrier protein [Mycobacterium sp.]|jgi:acyl carrier protein|nr:acyl carrier protein [Mycobacterium sp.]
MRDARSLADETIRRFLVRIKKEAEFDASTSLYGEGLGLDSLEVAELSVLLEDTLGSDPFSADHDITVVGQVLDFYAASA